MTDGIFIRRCARSGHGGYFKSELIEKRFVMPECFYRASMIDELVKSRKRPKIVIPVNTGIQKFQRVTKILDTGFHRCDDF
jgi:hypothetical protein